MKYLVLVALLASTICVPAFSKEQKDNFQTAKVVQVEKLPPRDNPNVNTPNNIPLDPGVSTYNVSIQVGDTIYTCLFKTNGPEEPSWKAGSEVQARVTKRVVYLKDNAGQVQEASIVGKKKADTQ